MAEVGVTTDDVVIDFYPLSDMNGQ